MPDRGDVWLADLNPRRGTEPGKTRPVLIVQAQALLDAGHPSTLIIPLTTKLVDDTEPLRIRVAPSGRLRQTSDLLMDQMRAIENGRLIQGPLTHLSSALLQAVADAIRDVLVLPEDRQSIVTENRRARNATHAPAWGATHSP